ncbi:COR domain-containing protein [Lacihabitans soyangensis]|uniref:non-specific serine/threonine protein kinase n=1 Tax=Lacihabitans soyangensis TaxID=869394 RepID=A0AAE3KX51_9BACT|nr:COR domain-containing protein [Lacihabitans soyangensis]MCP9764095.1 GTP-binding protein [Lacihabitans soyangensis]
MLLNSNSSTHSIQHRANISNTNITYLPRSLEFLINLVVFKSYNLEIRNVPIEIIFRGAKSIVNYFQSLKDEVEIFEAKLIIVGEGNVGKSSLMKRLVTNEFNESEKSTEGIQISYYFTKTGKTENFRVNLWDFGGQEIYHSTHQFFLTKRSLYLFVWTARDDDRKFEYWLNIVNLLSDNAPIICIQNKIDERIRTIDENSLKTNFQNIVSFNKVSAKNDNGIEKLKQNISQELNSLPHIGDKLPKVWLDIRLTLEELNKDYIDYAEYLILCKKNELNEERANFLSQYFHDLGVFLHFQNDEILNDIIFLKPEWATNAVYKILDTKKVQSNFGKFSYPELKEIWNDYPKDKYLHLVELMKKFELCFEFFNSREYIIPELLNPIKPDFFWDYSKNLSFEYHYEFMPDGIINRLIVRLNESIKGKLFWKFGVVFKNKDAEALVLSDPFSKKIKIFVNDYSKNSNNLHGEKETTKSSEVEEIKSLKKFALLELINQNIEIINKSLNNPKVKEMIPCCCDECNTSKDKYHFETNTINRAILKNVTVLQCPVSFDDVEIKALATGFTKIKKKSKMEREIGDIFIRESNVSFNEN